MYWSKIWFFLVALAGAVAATFALLLPHPAERDAALETRRRLVLGCNVVNIQLDSLARKHLAVVGTFARDKGVVDTLAGATAADKLDDDRVKKAHAVADATVKTIQADRPAFAMLVDGRGRVVARFGVDDGDAMDVAAGRPLVDQALAGYLADDLWILGKPKQLYFVTASPVIKDAGYAGAVVLGYIASKDFAGKLVITGTDRAEDTHVGFFLGLDPLATSNTVALDTSALVEALKARPAGERETDCRDGKAVEMRSGSEAYEAIAARLPGEAGNHGTYFAVYTTASEAAGFIGTVKKVEKGDLSFGTFPWLLVGGGFIIALGLGIGLMVIETDRPLRRLVNDTVKLAKGDVERLAEDAHRGKFGSIARSVNIHIDKLGREAKSAKKDLDQLLGPAPEGSLGTIDLLATAPPPRPGPGPSVPPPAFNPVVPSPFAQAQAPAAPAPPPPSEFRFGDGGGAAQAAPQRPSTRPGPVAPALAAPAPAPPPPVRSRPTPPPFAAPTPLAMPPPLAAPPTAPAVEAPAPAPMMSLGAPGPGAVSVTSTPMRLDDDILGSAGLPASPSGPSPSAQRLAGEPPAAAGGDVTYFAQVYEQFLAVKRSCNEPTTGLTFQKFSDKLVKNRDDLMAKTGCHEVKFTVYVKDGKAALKATPVKDA